MVNDNSLSDSVLIQIGVLEKDIKGLKDTLYSLEHSSESGRGYDRQVANIKNQIQQKTKQIQQFKRSIHMNDPMEQLKLMGFTIDAKDDDATEHGSIETYGKEKETETMPLEKDPVQAQDAEEPTNSVKDSYDMLKLFGFIMDDENWITINGAHVKIGEGESKGEAAKKFIKKKGGDPAPAKAGSTGEEKKESSEKEESTTTYKPGDTIKASNGKRIGKVINQFKNLNGEDIVKVKKSIMGEEVHIYVRKNDPDHTASYQPAKPTPEQKEEFKKDLKNLVNIQNTKPDSEVVKAEEKLRDKYIGLDLPIEANTLGIVDWEEVEKEFNSKE